IYADKFGEYTYSGQLESGTGLEGYYAYLEINTNSAPTAESVAIVNPEFAKVGQTLTGSYNYIDEDNDQQGTSTFRWLKSRTEFGTYSPIIGATSSNYTVQPSDADSYLKFEVTPVAASGTSPGIPVLSDASYKVTEAALADITPMAQTFYESSIADGTLGNVYIYAELTNAAFVTGTISGITMTGLPAGLSVGTITRISPTKIKIEFSGASTVHEYNASVLDPNEVKVTIPSAKLVGVANDLESANGFYIQFSNNAPTNLTTDDSDYNSVTISWDAPAGLNGSGTALQYYQVYRNDSYLEQVSHVLSKGAYTYTDTGLSTGVANTYKIQAIYNNDGSPFTNLISATPLGFTAFSIGEAEGIIDHETKSVTVTLDSGTILTNLVASFTAPNTNTTVKIGETTQSSGVTANDFRSPITYTHSSIDGSSTTYTVSVQTVLSAPEVIQTGLNETSSSFTAKWGAVESSIAYMLDVATDSGFTTFVSGYQDLNVGSGTSRVVNGLSSSSTYYFRVRAIADDPAMNSENSATATVNTSATGAGTGGTEIVNSETTTINVGSFDTGEFGTVTPSVTVTPSAFVSGANNSIEINMGHGTSPEGLIIGLSFDNPSIGNATFTISYAGLSYDPTEVYFRIVGGDLVIPSASSIDAENDIISITISGLSKEAKAAYELQIVSNDATGQTLPIVLSSFTANVLVQGKVRLNWTTQSESGMMGFHILRNTTDVLADAIIVSPLIEATNTSNLATYSFTDKEIPGNDTYHF
ncbi:MAG: fibronectin type III domain-containing protein, partial [Candidatus Cloacimonetes bacterium]|nr:fibronectin type III domain-containing protein [Candidatus Cloacimonadota bacterium]